MDLQQLHAALRRGVVEVVFRKANGERRVMSATLNDAFLPEENRGRSVLAETEASALSVWDTQNNGWRAFRVDSVISVNGMPFSASASMLSE
jgi:hypothetical protein